MRSDWVARLAVTVAVFSLVGVTAAFGLTPSAALARYSTGDASARAASTGDLTSAGGAPAAVTLSTASPDWPVYHNDSARTGYASSFPTLRPPLTRRWADRLDGAVYAEPLVVGGRVIAATEGDSVYGLDPSTGRIVWHRRLGTPVPLAKLPCGDTDPLGITGTPAFDPRTDTLFVVAEVSGPRHVLVALDPAHGAVRWSRGIDLAGDDPATHQQRAALAVGNGYVYVGLGGLYGDCGQYRGEVIGVPTSGHGATIAYRVPTRREGAVWATGGVVLDSHGNIYVSVGNGSSTSAYDGSDAVLELSSGLALRSRFAPARWAADNAADLDLGSLSPVLVPGGYVFIAGKSGIGYLLRQGQLGGIGGQLASRPVCRAFGAAASVGPSLYLPCTDGLRQVVIGTDASIHVGWHTASGANGPPVVGGGAVWSLDLASGKLLAIDPATGESRATIAVGSVPHFASPTLWGGEVFVGTLNGVTAVGGA
jgi:outer membrane protein assembly factor BamB